MRVRLPRPLVRERSHAIPTGRFGLSLSENASASSRRVESVQALTAGKNNSEIKLWDSITSPSPRMMQQLVFDDPTGAEVRAGAACGASF